MENETAPEEDAPPPELLEQAAGILSAALGGARVRLEHRDTLRERGRNRVYRLAVAEGPAGVPASIVVKKSYGEGDDAFDPVRDSLGSTSWRFYNEWASNAFLATLAAEPPFAAGIYGGDRDAGLIVLEDLGQPLSLADRMLGDDRPALEAALLAYARTMGRLHAATAGREAEFTTLRRSLGASEEKREREGVRWLRETPPGFQKLCAEAGVTLAPGFEADIEAVRAAMDEPGPFLAFAPCDTCPDNHRLSDDGTHVRFFDYEFAGFRHALLDAAYFHLPFPTCWCVNRLPAEWPARMERTYRDELVKGCPEAADDAVFGRQMTLACAYWLVSTMSWGWEGVLQEDLRWGISTQRQRYLLRLENFVARAEPAGGLPALTQTARELHAALSTRWAGAVEPMPLYQPFRDPAGPAIQ